MKTYTPVYTHTHTHTHTHSHSALPVVGERVTSVLKLAVKTHQSLVVCWQTVRNKDFLLQGKWKDESREASKDEEKNNDKHPAEWHWKSGWKIQFWPRSNAIWKIYFHSCHVASFEPGAVRWLWNEALVTLFVTLAVGMKQQIHPLVRPHNEYVLSSL